MNVYFIFLFNTHSRSHVADIKPQKSFECKVVTLRRNVCLRHLALPLQPVTIELMFNMASGVIKKIAAILITTPGSGVVNRQTSLCEL